VPYGIFLAYKALIINMFKSWMLKMGYMSVGAAMP